MSKVYCHISYKFGIETFTKGNWYTIVDQRGYILDDKNNIIFLPFEEVFYTKEEYRDKKLKELLNGSRI